MSIQNIEFKKIKKIHNQYIERAHIKNKAMIFTINDLSIQKTLYKKNKKICLDVSIEKTNQRIKRLNKLKKYTINKVVEKHSSTYEVMEKNYVKCTETGDSISYTFEIHPDCQFIKINHLDEKSEDSYKELTIDDTIDILVCFQGILYGKSKFTNKYVIHKVIRHEIIEDLNFEDCQIVDSDSEEDEDNEEVYSKKLKNRFGSFFNVIPEENVSVATIEVIPEKVKETEE